MSFKKQIEASEDHYRKRAEIIDAALSTLTPNVLIDDAAVSLSYFRPQIEAIAFPQIETVFENKKTITRIRKLQKKLRHFGIVENVGTVGVSGGADSVALADILYLLYPAIRIFPVIVHINHLLRGEESERDQNLVQLFASSKYPLIIARVDVKEHAQRKRVSIETAGRELRYRIFEKISEFISASYIFTAHTQNDLAETVLMNFLRGTSITGLAGFPFIRQYRNSIFLVKPLIDWDKAAILDYCTERELSWAEDSSNLSLQFTRNRVRHLLLPLIQQHFNPSIYQTLSRTAFHFQELESFLEDFTQKILQQAIILATKSIIQIKIPELKKTHLYIQKEAIQRVVEQLFDLKLSEHQIKRILSVMDKQTGKIETINRNIRAIRDRDILILTSDQEKPSQPVILQKNSKYKIGHNSIVLQEIPKTQFHPSPDALFVDSDLVPETLILRPWQAGDRFQPFGMKTPVKVSDFLTNRKVPVLKRQHIYVLTTPDDQIIALCGYQIDDRYKVKPETQKVLQITWSSIEEEGRAENHSRS